jgi:hypothetical protein
MSLYTDQMFLQTEIDRRYELAGVDRHDTHNHDRHRYDVPVRPLVAHPLVAFVVRLLGGASTPSRGGARRSTAVAADRPRHP